MISDSFCLGERLGYYFSAWMAKFESGATAFMMDSISIRARAVSLTWRTMSIHPIPVPDRTILPIFFATMRCSILSLISKSCFDAGSSPGHLIISRRLLPGPSLTDAGGSPWEQLHSTARMIAKRKPLRFHLLPDFRPSQVKYKFACGIGETKLKAVWTICAWSLNIACPVKSPCEELRSRRSGHLVNYLTG